MPFGAIVIPFKGTGKKLAAPRTRMKGTLSVDEEIKTETQTELANTRVAVKAE